MDKKLAELVMRTFEVTFRLTPVADPDYLLAWAAARLPALLEASRDADPAEIASAALDDIPERFRVASPAARFGRLQQEAKAAAEDPDLYGRIREDVKAQQEGSGRRNLGAQRLGLR